MEELAVSDHKLCADLRETSNNLLLSNFPARSLTEQIEDVRKAQSFVKNPNVRRTDKYRLINLLSVYAAFGEYAALKETVEVSDEVRALSKEIIDDWNGAPF